MADPTLPIDINLDKCIEWLESRDKIPKKLWQAELQVIEKRIKSAKNVLPEKMKELFKETAVDYWATKRIISMLAQAKTDSGESLHSMFGGYSDKGLQEWDGIRKAYDKKNIYLAESARILMRNVNYDIPALKKRMMDCDKQASELIRKHKDSEQQAKKCLQEYEASCQHFRVQQGEDLKAGIVGSTKRLPSMFADLLEDAKRGQLKKAADFYKVFTMYTLKASYGDMDAAAHEGGILPTLTRLWTEGLDLSVTSVRQDFITDLAELSTFLETRKDDMKTSPMAAHSLKDAPGVLHAQSESFFDHLLVDTQKVVAALKDLHLQQLIMIGKSDKYVERLVLLIEHNMKLSQRLKQKAREEEVKRQSLVKSKAEAGDKLAKLAHGTKELKGLVEREISKLYDNRQVNIFGVSC